MMSLVNNDTDVLIVGAGFGGIGLAIKLRKAGWNDFHIVEQADAVGGTWRDNTYPGAACDVPSHLYSFSFEPNPNWSKAFAPQQEILAYLQHCARKYNLYEKMTFNTKVVKASFNEVLELWQIETDDGRSIRARVLIGATGALNIPSIPDIPGLASFSGKCFHTAQWDHRVDLRGKRVAVVGTGASAIQVVPSIANQVKKLTLLQRTPPWVMPKFDHSIGALKRWSYRHLPLTQRIARQLVYGFGEAVTPLFIRDSMLSRIAEEISKRYIRSQINDKAMQDKVTPNYRIGCKRVLLSDDYYAALNQDCIDVVTAGIKEVAGQTIYLNDGTELVVDVIILATGFKVPVASAPFEVRGRNNRNLGDEWQEGAMAYKGISIAGYPNLALIMGPNTGPGNTSVIFYIESQLNYIMSFLKTLRDNSMASMDVRPDVQARFNEVIDERMKKTVWTSGCQSWYLTTSGRNTTLWPGFSAEYRFLTMRFEQENYEVVYRNSLADVQKGGALMAANA